MRKLITVLILIVLFSCKKEERVATDVASESAVAAPVRKEAVAAAPQRMIVRTANVRIIVADTSKTVDAVTRSAEAIGGFVADSQIWREGELLRARLTLRVPSAKLTETLAAIRATAKRVDNETIASNDVSEEYVDLESRVRNLEATEAELLELLKVARTTSKKASEVLEVHQQLMNIRGEIEQTKGRMRYLSQVSAMSSIALDIVPDAIAQPVVQPGWQPVVVMKNASRALVSVMQGFANAAIWFVIYLVPIFGILGLIIAAARKARRLLKA
ncbi:MAG TPA: DUF4349 domain-containing protein [Thermoanaerobaculia bacterium]|nr:DUF4349 domain-containing protein [Thermoanaerobaculia bacterium]